MTRAEVIALMASLKAKPEERRQAKRLHEAGVPRKQIAQMLNVSEHTVKAWRYQDQWPSRQKGVTWSDPGEHDPEMPFVVVGEELPVCFVCHGRCATWDGHPSCRGKAA